MKLSKCIYLFPFYALRLLVSTDCYVATKTSHIYCSKYCYDQYNQIYCCSKHNNIDYTFIQYDIILSSIESSHLFIQAKEASDRLYQTSTHVQRDEKRFANKRKEEAAAIAPYSGPKIVTHVVPVNDASKTGQVGEPNHPGTSRNALGGFYAAQSIFFKMSLTKIQFGVCV